MPRFRIVAAVAVLASLALASLALAASTKVTGGTTQITASNAAAAVLAANHITVTPESPATASGTTFTFPISGGSLNLKTLRGVIRHKGGLALSNGKKTVSLRQLTILSDKHGVSIFALVRGRATQFCTFGGKHHLRRHCVTLIRAYTARIATVTGLTVTGGKATGTVKITAATAGLINRLAGKTVAAAGEPLGTGTVAPTVA